jgi:hypothetical protein
MDSQEKSYLKPVFELTQTALKKAKEGRNWARNKLIMLSYNEAFNRSVGRFKVVSIVRNLAKNYDQLRDEVLGMNKNILNHVAEGMDKGSRVSAGYEKDNGFIEGYNQRKKTVGKETLDKVSSLIKTVVEKGKEGWYGSTKTESQKEKSRVVPISKKRNPYILWSNQERNDFHKRWF